MTLDQSEVQQVHAERDQATAAAQRAEPAADPAGPPEPARAELAAPEPETTPAEVSAVLADVVNPMLARRGVAVLTPDELARGGRALAPCVNRYVPWVATNHPELAAAGLWVVGVVAVRWGR